MTNLRWFILQKILILEEVADKEGVSISFRKISIQEDQSGKLGETKKNLKLTGVALGEEECSMIDQMIVNLFNNRMTLMICPTSMMVPKLEEEINVTMVISRNADRVHFLQAMMIQLMIIFHKIYKMNIT